jgi:DNA-binding transcriptional LysR family regulator
MLEAALPRPVDPDHLPNARRRATRPNDAIALPSFDLSACTHDDPFRTCASAPQNRMKSATIVVLAQNSERNGLSPRVVMTTSSNETIKQAVMAGMGVALISRPIGLELGMMTTLAIKRFALMRSWFVAHHRNMPLYRLMPG